MRVLYIFLISIAGLSTCRAQADSWVQPESWLLSEPTRQVNKDVKGSPELFDQYLEAVIYMKQGRKLEDLKLNLLNRDQIVVSKAYKGVEALYEVKEDDIRSFTVKEIDGSERTFLRIDKTEIADKLAQTGFYEVLNVNESFLRHSYKELKKAEKVGGYSTGPSMDEHVLKVIHYVRQTGQSKYQNIKFNKKSFTRVLGTDLAEQAKELIKKNKWKWKNEEHMMQLMQLLLR